MIENINKIFTTIIALSLLTFMGRADYNLPLFSFAMVLWPQKKPPQKIRIWYLILFSLIVDFTWMIFYAILWNSEGYTPFAFYNFTLVVSAIIFLVKVFLVVVLVMRDYACRNAVAEMPRNFLALVKGGELEEEEYYL